MALVSQDRRVNAEGDAIALVPRRFRSICDE